MPAENLVEALLRRWNRSSSRGGSREGLITVHLTCVKRSTMEHSKPVASASGVSPLPPINAFR